LFNCYDFSQSCGIHLYCIPFNRHRKIIQTAYQENNYCTAVSFNSGVNLPCTKKFTLDRWTQYRGIIFVIDRTYSLYYILCMRTTLDLPEKLINEAKKVTHLKTKTDVIIYALETVIQSIKLSRIKEFKGKLRLNIDIDNLRQR
ncbi:MAG: type II toxin-antitoxin system VapB family antitoxin, partial [Bacteroidales bacterium]|nr:type II toxin-antitoxin system VapB family antitoxin [Bacteroidales bacterium]